MENILDKTTQLWVKITGRKVDPVKYAWLLGPTGDSDRIGDKFIDRLAEEEGLERVVDHPGLGLVERMDDLGLNQEEKARLRQEVIDFYENTSDYNFEFWSSWCGIFKPFGWMLSILFSKRLQQLNLPLNSMDAAKGLNSRIIKLKKNGHTKWTIWYRILRSNKRVIYSGIYTYCRATDDDPVFLKVIFPLPNGNASVLMSVSVVDGALLLSSDGRSFGENGFYFTLKGRNGSHWAKHVRAMHEWIRVYVDEYGDLRADHNLNFHGLRFLNLHYKMNKVPKPG